jgi:hypothetical protein
MQLLLHSNNYIVSDSPKGTYNKDYRWTMKIAQTAIGLFRKPAPLISIIHHIHNGLCIINYTLLEHLLHFNPLSSKGF